MVEIRIDNTGDGVEHLYNSNHGWRDYVECENFEQQIVLTGNKSFNGCTEAEWYRRANETLNDIDCYGEYPTDVSDEVNTKLKEMYEKCRCTKDILVDVIRLLYPEDTFKTGTIEGDCQSDWQDYIIKGDVDVNLLEAYYFGKISDITVTTSKEEFGDTITDDELWRAEREEGLKEFFRNRYNFNKDEEIRIFYADGYTQITNWREVV